MTQYLGYNQEELARLHASWTAKEIEQQPACWGKTQRIVEENQAAINDFLHQALAASNTRIILPVLEPQPLPGGRWFRC